MKKHGILNRDLAGLFATLGHTDQIVISDCGLPIPDGVRCVDLSLEQGTPSFQSVLKVVLDDLEVEKMILAEEIKEHNQALHEQLLSLTTELDYVSHEAFKEQTGNAKVIIRTGENTPFANVILQSGVVFN